MLFFDVLLLLLLWTTFPYIWLVDINSLCGNLLQLWLLVPLVSSSPFSNPSKMGIAISRNRKWFTMDYVSTFSDDLRSSFITYSTSKSPVH